MTLAGLSIATSTATSATQAPIYIDAGGQGGRDSDGDLWLSDRYFVGGEAKSTTRTITGTRDQGVFQDWRRDVDAYRIPVLNGTYWVKLALTETGWDAPGERVFDVRSEGALAVDNLDIYQRAGDSFEAVYMVFKSTVADGRLDLTFAASVGAPRVEGIVVEAATSSTPTPTPTPTPTQTTSTNSVMWGMADNASFDSVEAGLGRKFALVREYRRLDQSFLTTRTKALAAGGRSLVLSVTARNTTRYLPYADIAAGKHDAAFLNGWASLQALPTPTYFIFQHEPDSTDAKASCTNVTDTICGPQFVAAWKHLYTLAKSRNFSNVIFAWTVTSYGFNPVTNVRNNYYWPGLAYTDWIGVDTYTGGCNSDWWGDLEEMLANSVKWLLAKAPNKSVILPEWGATEGPTATMKPNFFYDTPATLTKPGYNKIRGLVYYNERPETHCDYRINTTTASYNAFKSLGLHSKMSAKAGLR